MYVYIKYTHTYSHTLTHTHTYTHTYTHSHTRTVVERDTLPSVREFIPLVEGDISEILMCQVITAIPHVPQDRYVDYVSSTGSKYASGSRPLYTRYRSSRACV